MALGKREDTGNIKPGSYVRTLWSTSFGQGYGPTTVGGGGGDDEREDDEEGRRKNSLLH